MVERGIRLVMKGTSKYEKTQSKMDEPLAFCHSVILRHSHEPSMHHAIATVHSSAG